MKKIQIICTLGPSSFNKKVIIEMKNLGVNLFRINLSHTKTKDLPKILNYLKRLKVNKICIDTEGAQVRTITLKKHILLKKGSVVKIFKYNVKNTNKKLNFYPNVSFEKIRPKSKIFIGFDGLCLQILRNSKKCLITKVISEGRLESNKGVHFQCPIKLEPLTKKDIECIKIAMKHSIKYFAMSFVNCAEDISKLQKIVGRSKFIISKIETLNALKNLKSISKKSSALLIDRGDLSRYIPTEQIPMAQDQIAKFSKKNNVTLFVATNLLETMVKSNLPTRAESHDIYSTLKQGVQGLVLAAETAIGIQPISCVKFLKRCIKINTASRNFIC
jgi:pyruvate kinase